MPYLGEPYEHLLVGEPVKRSGESVHAGGVGQVGVAECGPHQMAGVGAHVTALVVTVV